jgi:hypothetical protein
VRHLLLRNPFPSHTKWLQLELWLTTVVAYYRYYRVTYSSAALRRSKKGAHVNQSGYDVRSLKLVMTHFGGRVIGTTLGWGFNDFVSRSVREVVALADQVPSSSTETSFSLRPLSESSAPTLTVS